MKKKKDYNYDLFEDEMKGTDDTAVCVFTLIAVAGCLTMFMFAIVKMLQI